MPADYINKLARMFQDIKVSNDLNQAFKTEYMNKGDIAGTAYKVSHLCCNFAGINKQPINANDHYLDKTLGQDNVFLYF